MLIICMKTKIHFLVSLPHCFVQPHNQLKSIPLPAFCKINISNVIYTNMCDAASVKRAAYSPLLLTSDSINDLMSQTTETQTWYKYLKLQEIETTTTSPPTVTDTVLHMTYQLCYEHDRCVWAMAFWQSVVHFFVCKRELNNSILHIIYFVFLLQRAPTPGKQWSLPGPLNRSPGLGSTKARCGS